MHIWPSINKSMLPRGEHACKDNLGQPALLGRVHPNQAAAPSTIYHKHGTLLIARSSEISSTFCTPSHRIPLAPPSLPACIHQERSK